LQTLGLVVWNLFLIGLGSALCAVGLNGILIPHKFLGAGFVGVSLVIHYLVPSLSLSALYFLLNIPVFAVGWLYVGRRFFLYSLAGAAIFTCALEYVHVPIPIHEKLPAALMAGILIGGGGGVILRSLGSAGGLDILSVIFMRRFSIRLGTTVLFFNSVVLLAGAILISLEDALFTLIYIYVSSVILNIVVTGLSQRKAVTIISPKWKEILGRIKSEVQRGVTVLNGSGGYSGEEVRMLYTVVAFREVPRIKKMVGEVDPDAFLVVSDTQEVVGHRIGNQPHW
jgi:uncharacterized membrane-anchored protein YitT (DUF2179 family)